MVAGPSHAAIMDAVYRLLKEKPARDLTMDAVAKRADVGKPTLYKWWMVHGYLGGIGRLAASTETLRLIGEFLIDRFADAEKNGKRDR
jgi:hypothetical protein